MSGDCGCNEASWGLMSWRGTESPHGIWTSALARKQQQLVSRSSSALARSLSLRGVARAGNQEPTAVSGNQGRFVIEIGRRLKLCRERISVMGPMLLADELSRTKDEKGMRSTAGRPRS